MPVWGWIVLLVLAAAIVAAVGWFVMYKRRSGRLRSRFGPEYEHTVQQAGSRREAESELLDRQQRRDELDIRPLQPAARERYVNSWGEIQARFVDQPREAVREADALVNQVMLARGYPVEDFERRAANVSVDHPHLVENYRSAQAIALRSGRGQASTEDLRQALVHYRALFEELLESAGGDRVGEVG